MNLTSPSQVKAWCIENGFHPNKVLGQNFLIDRNALTAIVDAGLRGARDCAPCQDEARSAAGKGLPALPSGAKGMRVLEIGPGLGVLTEEMLSRGAEVTAVEKDPILAARLAESLGNPPNLKVIAGDALDYIARGPDRESAALDVRKEGSFDAMVSNLPYQAGTRILLDLVQLHTLPIITALVQTEVAERLAAPEGSKTRGLAGVWAQLDYDIKVVRKVAASCFWPRPTIGSSVVTLTRHNRNVALNAKERDFFHSLTKTAFAHRRKQLGSVFKDMIQCKARAETLSNEDWINLVKGLMHENT